MTIGSMTGAAQTTSPAQGTNQTQQTPQRVPAYLPYMIAMGKMIESLRAQSAGFRERYATGQPSVQKPTVAASKRSATGGSTVIIDCTGDKKAQDKKKTVDPTQWGPMAKDTVLTRKQLIERAESFAMHKSQVGQKGDVAIQVRGDRESISDMDKDGNFKQVAVRRTVPAYEIWRDEGNGKARLIGLSATNPDAPEQTPAESAPTTTAAPVAEAASAEAADAPATDAEMQALCEPGEEMC